MPNSFLILPLIFLYALPVSAQASSDLEKQLREVRDHYYVHVDTAIHRARRLLPRARSQSDPYLTGLAYETVARYYLDNGVRDSTRLLLTKAQKYYTASERIEAKPASLWIRATLASISNRDAESLRLSQRMAEECKRINDDRCLARAYWSMGGAFFLSGSARRGATVQRYGDGLAPRAGRPTVLRLLTDQLRHVSP